jgi:hypothetical protein
MGGFYRGTAVPASAAFRRETVRHGRAIGYPVRFEGEESMRFSATEAAFEGFRVVRRHPLALVFWVLFYVVTMAIGFALIGADLVNLLAAAERLEAASGDPTPEMLMPVFLAYMKVFAIVLPLSLITGAILHAGIVRAVLEPEQRRFGYLRVGKDEARVLVVMVVLGLAVMALSGIVFMILSMIAAAAVATGTPALWFVVAVLGMAAAAAGIWAAVRFSLAVPITVAENRIAILDSFALTRGRFWPLLGMAILAGVMSMVVGLLGTLVFLPIDLLTGGRAGLAALEGQSLQSILATAWPAVIGWVVVNAIMAALQVAVVYAPFSAAYRDIKAVGPTSA